ncbi:MAG: FliM/FliN family flagellar motor switch protein [Planctomycetales bacterium]|nr:FliM/FliN family flagellar motor switch protein [Planctomycetales bacterium]
MASESHARPFDFRKPCRLPIEVENQFTRWQEDVCACAPQLFRSLVHEELEWKTLPVETAHPEDGLDPLGNVAYHLRNIDRGWHTILAFEHSLARALVKLMLRDDTEEEEPRPMTDIEFALLEMAIQQLLQVLAAVSPESVPCTFELGELVAQPRLGLLYPLAKDVAVLAFEMTSTRGGGKVRWIFTEEQAENAFPLGPAKPNHKAAGENQIRDVALRMKFDVAVRLGSARLHVAELANLQEGDVIVLDQRVSDKMSAFIEDRCVFEGWPGRSGSRQSFKIDRVVAEPE